MISNKSIELLAPCGSPDVLNAAVGEGADSVYLGLFEFNARHRAQNFTYKEYEALTEKLHDLHKKVYVTLNTVFEARESDMVYNVLKYLNYIKPDAIIVQDLGIIKMVNEFFPELKIHASTQMNISSTRGVNYLSKFGVTRVVLGRELSFEEIKNIRSNTNSELEIFTHGALCVSVSGLCLFSSYLGGKSANRGLCTQACRRLYTTGSKSGYFFSPHDLMLIEHIPDLINIGINSLKIEGRMKSAEYVATVVRAYRYVIDNYMNDKEAAIAKGVEILKNDFARKKTSYFFMDKNNRNFINPDEAGGTGIFLGKIKDVMEKGHFKMGFLNTRQPLAVSDHLRLHKADDSSRVSIKIKKILNERDGVYLAIPLEFDTGDSVFLINMKESQARYPHIIPKILKKYKRHPGKEPCPHIKLVKNPQVTSQLPHGLYVKIARVKDIFVTQAIKPAKLILHYNKITAEELKRNAKSFSYRPEDIILYLDPYFSWNEEVWLKDHVDYLAGTFQHVIVNNIGQLGLLKDKGLNLICGPYLYTFNPYSIEYLNQHAQISYFISPLENSKDNLLKSTALFDKNRWFVTLFTYPELFQIQANLNSRYDFDLFMDKLNNSFNLISLNDKTIVTPEKPFSIIEKTPELNKAGFNKFILDFSYLDLKKNFYKSIVQMAQSQKILTGSSRFNWKEGFFWEKRDDNRKEEPKKDDLKKRMPKKDTRKK